MKSLLALLGLAMAVVAVGQAPQIPPPPRLEPFRMEVRHADPWAIKFMLEGLQIVTPEISTLFNFMGMPPQTGQAVNALFKDGKLVVNPTDNSIWFFPDNLG